MDKRFFIILAVVIVVAGGIFWFVRPSKNTPKSNAQPTNHVEGKGSAGVTFIEYGDFQCPACGAYYPVVKQMYAAYSDYIFFQFRNFPLTTIHQNAFAGARAAEAADKQGKYWEMHDKLYEGQQDWGTSSNPFNIFKTYATSLGLDANKFQQDYQSQTVNDVINADIAEGQKVPVTATPTFILDGKKVDNNPQDQQSFNALIEAEIKKKDPNASFGNPTSTDTSGQLPAATPAAGQ